jgi:cobalt-zinc-cadmium efflux system membrane fusion protein
MLMKTSCIRFAWVGVVAASLLVASGCGKNQGDVAAQEAPPAQQIVPGVDVSLFSVPNPEQYPPVTAVRYDAPSELVVTGVVMPDISRSVPVITLASGRVVDIRARLGDTVQKDQVLLRVRSDDVGMGFDAYRKAVADELLARKQLERTKDLYQHGAMAQQDLEVAQDNEDDAKTTLETATEHLRLLGNDPDKPNGVVDLVAPISGVITDQEITNAASVQAYSSPNPFTISDLTYVWVVCDVYES